MKKMILGIFVTASMLFAFSTTTYAQKKVNRDVKAVTVEGTRSSNPNIKSNAPTTDEVETKSRGTCTINFVNRTGYYVNVYVDGYYRGQLSPWGSGSVSVSDGYTTVYCLSAGGTREWSDAGTCSGYYTFTLYP